MICLAIATSAELFCSCADSWIGVAIEATPAPPMSSLFPNESRGAVGRHLNALAFETLAMTGIKLMCTIAGFTGASVLPRAFVRELFQMTRREVPSSRKHFTVNSFCQEFLPITSARVKSLMRNKKWTCGADWFDKLKWNVIPAQLTSMDLVLQPLVADRQIKRAVLGFALGRRMLNESSHFEWALRRYGNQRFGINSHADFASCGEVLQSMVEDGVDRDRLTAAIKSSKSELGSYPRTGYLTPVVKTTLSGVDRKCKASSVAAYVSEVLDRLNHLEKIGQAGGVSNDLDVYSVIMNFEFVFQLASDRFHAYQIETLLQRFAQATHVRHADGFPACAGPGMIPLTLAFRRAPQEDAADENDPVVEQGLDESDDSSSEASSPGDGDGISLDVAGEFDDSLDGISVQSHYTVSQRRKSILICGTMTDILKGSELLKQCGLVCGCDLSELVCFDLTEYAICEHRRVLVRPKQRKSKAMLKACKFLSSHKDSLASARKASIDWLKRKHPVKRKRC